MEVAAFQLWSALMFCIGRAAVRAAGISIFEDGGSRGLDLINIIIMFIVYIFIIIIIIISIAI